MGWLPAGPWPGAAVWVCICCIGPCTSSWPRVSESCGLGMFRSEAECGASNPRPEGVVSCPSREGNNKSGSSVWRNSFDLPGGDTSACHGVSLTYEI